MHWYAIFAQKCGLQMQREEVEDEVRLTWLFFCSFGKELVQLLITSRNVGNLFFSFKIHKILKFLHVYSILERFILATVRVDYSQHNPIY